MCSRGPGEAGEGRAGDQHRLAERDDDEQPAALGHVAAFDVPVGGGRAAEDRHPEADDRRDGFDADRDRPQRQPGRAVGQGAGDPEQRPPRPARAMMRTKLRKLPASWFFSAQSMNRLRPTCMTAKASAKAKRAVLERLGDRRRHHQSGQHQREQHAGGPAVRSGSSQLVIHAVSIQAHHTASISRAVCNAPSGVRCSNRPCESCVTANTNTRSKNSST